MWLVTWESFGRAQRIKKKVAAIIDYRKSAEQVRQLVEQLYAVEMYAPFELLALAQHKWKNPYPARWGHLGRMPWYGEILCGHNPYLYARLVDNLRPVGEEGVAWDERPKPSGRDFELTPEEKEDVLRRLTTRSVPRAT